MMTNDDKKYYVYTHSKDGVIFYVGKGKDNRAHSKDGRNKEWIKESESGYDIDISDKMGEDDALILEEELIRKYGRRIDGGQLVNIRVKGYITRTSDDNEITTYYTPSDEDWYELEVMSEIIKNNQREYYIENKEFLDEILDLKFGLTKVEKEALKRRYE